MEKKSIEKRALDEENAALKNSKESVDDEKPATEKLRELICQEDDKERVVLYTTEDLEDLIADLEKQLQKLWCNKPEREKLFLDLGHTYYKLCKFQSAKD